MRPARITLSLITIALFGVVQPVSAQIDAVTDNDLNTFFQWFRNTFEPLLPLALIGVGIVGGAIFVTFIVTRIVALFKRVDSDATDATDAPLEADTAQYSHDPKVKITPIEDWELDKLIGSKDTKTERKRQRQQDTRAAGWVPVWGRPAARSKRKRKEKDIFADINVFGPEKRGKRGRRVDDIFQPATNKRGRRNDDLFDIFMPSPSKRGRRTDLFSGPSIFDPPTPRRRRRR